MSLKRSYKYKVIFTPKMMIAAPLKVAVCPPLGFGDTPSING